MAMDVREKIVELLTEFYGVDPMYLGADTNALIEYLIAKGVTVQETARRCVDGKPVPVVRCKDCVHSYDDLCGLCCTCGPYVDCVVQPEFYCADGKRKKDK